VEADTQVIETHGVGDYGHFPLGRHFPFGRSFPLEYTIVVGPSWRDGLDQKTLRVSDHDFYRVQVGDQVHVAFHPGALSVPWGRAAVSDIVR
jgi:hypothetical protein